MLFLQKCRAVFLCVLAAICLTGGAAWRVLALSRTPQPRTAQQTGGQNDDSGFQLALPNYKYSFPRDHAAHPAYQTEWWYFTGHLQSARDARHSQKNFGYQLTFFRTALTAQISKRKSKWAARDIIFAHLALTDESAQKFFFDDRISRANLKLAGADASTPAPRIWLDDWALKFTIDGNSQTLHAAGTDARTSTSFALSLQQRALKSLVLQGQNGVSQKSEGRGHASHYYSFPLLKTIGIVKLGNDEYSVSGQSWFDHEFGSNQMAREQAGWDWFSIQLDDGRELMLYQMRLKNGTVDPFSSGTLIEKNGSSRHLKRADFRIEVLGHWQSKHTRANYPARWKVSLPRENLVLEIAPTVADQELDTHRSTGIAYWEGSVGILDANQKAIGRGYVELTGYAQNFNATF